MDLMDIPKEALELLEESVDVLLVHGQSELCDRQVFIALDEAANDEDFMVKER